MENNKVGAQFYCLEEPAFFELIDILYERLKGRETPDKWIPGESVMSMLNISSPTTLQKLRDTGAFRISQLSKKVILYDRESVEEYIEKHARKPFKSWR
ncbi:helix-turn-helix domain-containing protein [Mucilaginibacter psychrotolerans]|uniref:DNA-binding protein n=1 Tax=Mucilaginibacter psychrotolerans TaxID=1524096 RepID=A0A4Y8SED2_9SPHI|nr:helix-turn-helix domain-containing protein [Mucilaginibacter psychrotolerans]TFF37272.1 DNA-binding protein [Mucilaginibacter psychrotolerans]